MNKTAIKNFAIQSRKDLIQWVSQKAYELGITKDNVTTNTITSSDAFVVFGKVLDTQTKKQRNELISQISIKGYTQVMEEVAYTWFNRFIALRYMEVNGYLPSKIRVFTNHSNEFRPELLDQALYVNFEGVKKEKVFEYLDKNDDEELYKYLFIAQCNDMNQYLPEMFEKIGNYTELLLPDGLLKPNGVLANMIRLIDEEDWKEQVEIIGWLYQYYNSEVKDETYALLKKNVKVTKERIPSVTQLFTPDWIVRYMVENSLGRLWVEGHDANQLKSEWKYYLEEAEQEAEVVKKLEVIRQEYKKLRPIDITVIDPSMGSGHILVYAFEVLMQIYVSEGYSEREAARLILEHNLYGLDIDDRAYQLSYFALMMKARKYSRRILNEPIELNICSIQESNPLPYRLLELIANQHKQVHSDLEYLFSVFKDAKEYGSILNVKDINFTSIEKSIEEFERSKTDNLFDMEVYDTHLPLLKKIVKQAKILSKQYHVVTTNPPYMGSSGMSVKLSDYVKKHFPDSKSDLFAVFMEKCTHLTQSNYYQAMITMHSWMFLIGFEKLRSTLIKTQQIINMAHLGPRAFDEISGEVVQVTTYVTQKRMPEDSYFSKYFRLVDYKSEKEKEDEFLNDRNNQHITTQSNFSKIPGSPIAYWTSSTYIKLFESSRLLRSLVTTKQGLKSSDDKRFFRLWYEINLNLINWEADSRNTSLSSSLKWIPLNKGGNTKWFGENNFVINWENNGFEIKDFARQLYKSVTRTITSIDYYFVESITWPQVTSLGNGFRFNPKGSIFSSASPSMFLKTHNDLLYVLGLLNTKVVNRVANILNPTINLLVSDLLNVPYIFSSSYNHLILGLVNTCIALAKKDWDSYETSWDFERHPLMKYLVDDEGKKIGLVSTSFGMWSEFAKKQFYQLKANEEELNRIFIEIYGLQDELTPEVEEKDVTVRKADLGRDIRSFVSYAVGCLFGRYSLDVDGLAYAGGEWDASKYKTILPDDDNIIPISDEAYFEDDLLSRFVEFVKVVYGSDTLEENLEFIANALGTKGTSARDAIRNYLLNDFYKDHVKIYQKRPIYWLFDSGKQNGFKALIYMHRYNQDTLAKMRIDYVHRTQEHYRNEIVHLSDMMDRSENQKDRVRFGKEIEKLKAKEDELLRYEQILHHVADQRIAIDLDDGVVVNYAKFDGLVSKIK